jgi:hypothetical protein
MKDEIRLLRVQIDGLAQLTKGLRQPVDYKWDESFHGGGTGVTHSFIQPHSIEITRATDSLYLSKAWLGKVLGALGEDTPYAKDGKRKTVEDIEPAADQKRYTNKDDLVKEFWPGLNHIEKVDWLRQEIGKVLQDFAALWQGVNEISGSFYDVIWQYLSEARIWLGFELQRYQKENK